jgi:hypothetical protein
MSGRVTAIDVFTSIDICGNGLADYGNQLHGIKWEPFRQGSDVIHWFLWEYSEQSNPSVIWVGTEKQNPGFEWRVWNLSFF